MAGLSLPSLVLDPVSLLIGAAVGGLLVAAFVLPRFSRLQQRQSDMGRAFESLALQSLKGSQEQFLHMATEKLRQSQMEGAFDLEKRQQSIASLVDPITRTLKDMEGRLEGLGKAGAGLEAQLKVFSDDQRALREQTQNLVHAMRNPAVRGRWGEMQLQRAFEIVGFVEGVHYRAQASVSAGEGGRQQPDFVVSLPNGIQIVIDVKTPLDPYWQILDQSQDQGAQQQALGSFRQNIRKHLKGLSQKEYARQFDSPEFVVMFLPSEGLYSLAVSQDQGLLEEAARSNVILASPTTVMGLLRVVMYGWQQQSLAEEARTVAALASDLYRRIAVFGDHMGKLGRNLQGAVEGYNKAVGSLDAMVLPVLRKFRDLQVPTGGKDVPEAGPVEALPRALSSPELSSFSSSTEEGEQDGAEIVPLKSTYS